MIAIALDYFEKICDKTIYTIDKSIELMPLLLDHQEYWVRQKAIKIIEMMFRTSEPSKFDGIIEICEAKLFDTDKNVRVATVDLFASIFTKTFDHFPDLYEVYARMLNDSSWKVRAKALEGILRFISDDNEPPMKYITLFTEYLYKLFHDADEEIRGLTTEVFKRFAFHLNSDDVNELLLLLLNDNDWEIREKAIWIIGEIGHLDFDSYISLFQRLIELFSDEIMIIQTKAIDAFVKIGQKKGLELFEFFIPYIKRLSSESKFQDIRDGISESIIFITIHNMNKLLPLLINHLRDPHKQIREVISSCLVKIYMEKPDKFEEILLKLFQSIDPNDWRQRKETTGLLGDLAYVLHIQSIAVWITINLQNILEQEEDLDVKDEIIASLEKIENLFPKIQEEIEDIYKKKDQFYEGLNNFHEMTRNLRIDTENLVNQKKFNDAEILIEDQGNRISEKLNEYENLLYESSFKRFSVDVIQDFKEFKEEIFEHISDIKNVMFNLIVDGRSQYLEVLQKNILSLRKKIDEAKSHFDEVKNMKEELTDISIDEDPIKIESFLDSISEIQKRIYALEFEVGQTWLNNLEFKEFLKEITLYWVDTKIEIQQYLANIYQQFSLIHSEIQAKDQGFSLLKQKITFDFLNNNLQNIVIQAIQSQREVLERFDSIVKPVYKELKKRKFKETRNLVELTLNNFYTSIENYNREINKVYQNIDKLTDGNESNADTRKYLTNWDEVKNQLLNKIHIFKNTMQNQIFIEELKEYLKFMNPLPIEQLATEFKLPKDTLTKKVFSLIKNHSILAEIKDNKIIQPERPIGEFYLNFHKKIEIIGSKIIFNLRIYNPTKFFINDIGLVFLYPKFLNFIPQDSDPTDIFIQEFEPEAIRIIQWQFKINKPIEKKYDLKKCILNVNYCNPLGKIKAIQKETEIII